MDLWVLLVRDNSTTEVSLYAHAHHNAARFLFITEPFQFKLPTLHFLSLGVQFEIPGDCLTLMMHNSTDLRLCLVVSLLLCRCFLPSLAKLLRFCYFHFPARRCREPQVRGSALVL